MGIPNTTKQSLADSFAALGAWISLHTAAAGVTGASEATGGSYARVQSTPTAGTTGIDTGSSVNILCAAGTYVEAGAWNASTAGIFRASAAFTGGNVIVSGTGASIDVVPTWNMN